ncbi:MAG TPA: hypothetical protein VFE57_05925 [Cyclobacteriaceae bacterium]|nr:hypothetical protein [Cyclobacteriaceae bacterium]
MKLSFKRIAIFSTVMVVGYILWTSLSQPGPQGLSGNFKQMVFVRNEQNTGPVVRVYTVTLQDTLWNEMTQYGDYMPYTKYGTTTVYFFLNSKPAPASLVLSDNPIPDQFKTYCIGKYEKSSMGQVSLLKFPFRK